MSWLTHSPQPQPQSQSRSRMRQYRVQIREKQLNAKKNSIRQEILRSNTIDELLEELPRDIQNANWWSNELYHAYSQTRKYSLSNQHVIDIFKLLEKFPIRNTLMLFEVVILRANEHKVDLLFQYDVMRVLHGFINSTGQKQMIRCPQSAQSFEECRIINEVVITSAVQTITRNSAEDNNYTFRLELARITLRIIAELCKKAFHIRNFVILNHKTFTYCLRAHKCFENDLDNQFYYFLEAATYIPFNRWQDSFGNITKKIINLFYRAKMSVRVELLAEKEERSYLTAYQSLVMAIRNLFRMDIQWVREQLQTVEIGSGTVTLGMIVNIVAQCNYVMEFPAAHQQNQTLMPIKLMQATLFLGMQAIEALSRPFPHILRHPLYDQYVSELVRFLRNREIGFCYGSFVIARRMAIFQLDQFVFQIKQNEEKINNFIAFNPQNQSDNLIALIAYLLESDTDFDNRVELCKLIQNIMDCFPAYAYQPFISRCQLFSIMLDRLVELQTWCGEAFQQSEQALKIHIFFVLLTFLNKALPQVISRLPFYASLLGQYTQRIEGLMLHQKSIHYQTYGSQLLQWLSDHTSQL